VRTVYRGAASRRIDPCRRLKAVGGAAVAHWRERRKGLQRQADL